MLTRVFVAGEDAAHLGFVRGFLSAFDYPAGRIASNPAGAADPGRIGDGRERMFADAREFARALWSRRNHETSVLVLLHDQGDEEAAGLRLRVLARVSEEARIELAFLVERALLLLPSPETEGWIAEMLQIGYDPSHIGTKHALKSQAFHFGKEAGKTCLRGEQDRLPRSMRTFCEEVARYTGGLR